MSVTASDTIIRRCRYYFVNGMDSIIIPNNISGHNAKSTVIYRTL